MQAPRNKASTVEGDFLLIFQTMKKHLVGVATTCNQFYLVVIGKNFDLRPSLLSKKHANTPYGAKNRRG